MTKETIYRNFLEDPLLSEKNYITKERAEIIKLIEPTEVKLLEVIKIAINESVDGESEGVIIRKINKLLSNPQV